ncbi:MAG TPA: PKD domain-containing protein [Flavobacteriales bacterium]|nr:PKD domain-containing protein [Flavobacteriales bacterium]
MRVKVYLYTIVKYLKYWPCIVLLFSSVFAHAGDKIFFTPNRGQWDNRIQYQLEVNGGYFYLENNCQTYYFLDRPHDHPNGSTISQIKAHAFQTIFKNANPHPLFIEENPTGFYSNYFIGNDPAKWRSGIYSYKKITYQNLYTGIDYIIGESKGELKSDYVVHRGFDPSTIQLEYKGVDDIKVVDGKLVVKTSLAEITENIPYAYQVIEGKQVPVQCEYVLNNNTVSFKVGFYNPGIDLIIDPILYFSTYIGASTDNFGCTATYDKHKNLYGGALVYSGGIYPTTFGAFMTSFSGGAAYRDMGITKFDSSGTFLQYSTYLGGSNGTEVPHSLVVDNNDQLFVFGTTGSSNYPVTGGAYDVVFNGGGAVNAANQGLDYPTGTDIVITKFNAGGTAMLGSTFVGGTGNDGVNNSATLKYNYGDFIRGEIILDNSGNPIVCTVTGSSDFPTTGGATYAGGLTDAVVFKMNLNLTAITWSHFYGGANDDAGYGIQPDLAGNLFFTGGTNSSTFPTTAGTFSPSPFGAADGFLAKLSAGGVLLASTYVGTAGYDQSYLIQTDLSNNVYIFGQTSGAYPQTAGIYNNGNSGQFIHKFDNNLATSFWSTCIGRNAGTIDISPTAFLVNDCYKIFICGWGGTVNSSFSLATASTTVGLPITPSSFQTTTDGSDFYLAIFSQDMAALEYGTYFGGPVSSEHVDGGTARFDKDGFVYQAVCGGCGGHDDFPTTPGAWSNTNDSFNCNLAVFKFNMETVVANTTIAAASPVCTIPYSFNFTNLSTLTNVFYWDFGDGTNDTTFNPSHGYAVPGTYTVMLVAIDTTTCGKNDTVYTNVTVPNPFILAAIPNDTVCLGSPANVDLTLPGVTYTWTPSADVSNPTGSIVDITPTGGGPHTYYAIGLDSQGCVDTTEITIYVHEPTQAQFSMTFDTCNIPATFTFNNTSTGTLQYFWDFGDGTTSTLQNPPHVYTTPGNYVITLITIDTNACGFNDTMQTPVFIPAPLVISVTGDNQICLGESSQLQVSGGGNTFQWTPAGTVDFPTSANPIVTPTGTTTYDVYATDTNGCKDTASFPVTVIQPPTAGFNTNFTPCIIPASVAFTNTSTNSSTFIWMLDGIVVNATDLVHVFNTPGTYTITLIAVDTSDCGFNDTAQTTIFLPPPAVATATGTDTVCIGLSLPVYAGGGVTYQWIPPSLYDDPTSPNPILTPPASGNYTVVVTDTNGCSDSASVPVFVFPVPTVSAGNDFVYDFGNGPTFNPNIPPNGYFYWSPPDGLSCTDCLHPEATPESTTTYYLHFTDQYGCHFVDSLLVMVTPSVYAPNAFTLDNDGTNEVFKPIVRNLASYELFIFDRWGELIFYTNDTEGYWDGTYKGRKCKEDVYVWKIKYASQLDPEINREARGHVTLLR